MVMKGHEWKWKEMITAKSKKTLGALYRCSKCASHQLGERVRLRNVSGKSMNFRQEHNVSGAKLPGISS